MTVEELFSGKEHRLEESHLFSVGSERLAVQTFGNNMRLLRLWLAVFCGPERE